MLSRHVDKLNVVEAQKSGNFLHEKSHCKQLEEVGAMSDYDMQKDPTPHNALRPHGCMQIFVKT